MGLSLQFFFFFPKKIKSAYDNVFGIFLYFYGQKNDFTHSRDGIGQQNFSIDLTPGGAEIISCDRPGTIWLLDTFLILFKQTFFFLKI